MGKNFAAAGPGFDDVERAFAAGDFIAAFLLLAGFIEDRNK